ncbi:hypothetical protein V2H29_01845 [Lysinibacillus fusiformis]|uniref:hypothetical protein n=1 Tax=Lysinibacillus TaxID=400634 RepID=UPI00232C4414|nr:hypothetical protein [Lysinibacillus sp. OF-1]MEE3805687.1 hypothetical protein [Lysinibacillus fusiformis]WCH46607.1 hypothetical protein NV349_16135 [Lysinibacillus sp. OF-1]
MSKHIDKKDFALAVVSGNPVAGNTPEEIAKKALELYQTAVKVADDHNKLNGSGMKVLK